jgi:hypothetical protein
MSIFEFAAWIDCDLSLGGFALMQLERLYAHFRRGAAAQAIR